MIPHTFSTPKIKSEEDHHDPPLLAPFIINKHPTNTKIKPTATIGFVPPFINIESHKGVCFYREFVKMKRIRLNPPHSSRINSLILRKQFVNKAST